MRTRFALALASLLSASTLSLLVTDAAAKGLAAGVPAPKPAAAAAPAPAAPAPVQVETVSEPVPAAALAPEAAAPVAAAEQPAAYACHDAAGKIVPSATDTSSPYVFRTVVKDGVASIVYNPNRLARLSQQSTLFLYAQECARLNMGMAGSQQNTLLQARTADCRAINNLKKAGQVTDEEIPFIEGDLVFSDEEWKEVAGPVRGYALATCNGDQPDPSTLVATAPAQAQTALVSGNRVALARMSNSPAWAACVRKCAQPMLRCGANQKCQDPHLACVARCDARL